MALFDNIKDFFGKRKIEKTLATQKRRVAVTNFSSAKSIGIIYHVKTVDYQDFVNKYVDYLRQEIGFKKIVALGYCGEKELPNFITNQSLKFEFFTLKDLKKLIRKACSIPSLQD